MSDLESDHVLPVDLADVVLGQQAVACGGAVLDQRGDFAVLVDEAHVARAVFVHGDGALEGPGGADTDINNMISHAGKQDEEQQSVVSWSGQQMAPDGSYSSVSGAFNALLR